MDLFRRKQKLIFWIVTIIIVPSFVLVWGVSGYEGATGAANFNVGTVDGKEIPYPEFEAFQKRLTAALGGMPLQVAGAPGAGTDAEGLYKYLFAYTILKDAEKAGFAASGLQVGTYLESGHPTLILSVNKADPGSKERAVDALCRQMQVSRAELLRGIREWLTIGNYLQADANLSAVNDETVYTFYSLNKAECVIKRVQFPQSPEQTVQAREEIMAKPAEELDAEIRDFAASRAGEPAYREPARWRFAWVMTPSVLPESVMQPSEEEIRARYEQGKSFLYNDAPLSDVRERIVSELLAEGVDRQTVRNFTVDVDPQLRGANQDLSLDELVKLTPLVKYSVTAGDTGEETLVVGELLKKLPAGADLSLQNLLAGIDGQQDAAARDAIAADWKTGFNMMGRPFKAEGGFFRLRLLDYVPSVPAPIDDAEGNIRPEIREQALTDLIEEAAHELNRVKARDYEAKLRAHFIALEDGQPVPDAELAADFDKLPTETLTYLQITDSQYAIGRLPIGDMTPPRHYTTPTGGNGEELIVMVDRRVPGRADYAAETEEAKTQVRALATLNYQGNFGFTAGTAATGGLPGAVIQPSPAIMAGLADRFSKGLLGVNLELITPNEG